MNKELEMPEHVFRYRESGLNISAYCQQNGLAYHSMQYWIKKLRKVTNNTVAGNKDMFVELRASKKEDIICNPSPFPDQTALGPQVELTFASGLVVKIYG
jgi:hypothetical protein